MKLNLEVNEGRLIHIWQGIGEVMVSFEDTKTLTSFCSVDSAINWLYLAGYKITARKLNKLKGEVTQ
jgi:hypothetical protein